MSAAEARGLLAYLVEREVDTAVERKGKTRDKLATIYLAGLSLGLASSRVDGGADLADFLTTDMDSAGGFDDHLIRSTDDEMMSMLIAALRALPN
jgi:hypothetical protein